jgi:hypothetical protein
MEVGKSEASSVLTTSSGQMQSESFSDCEMREEDRSDSEPESELDV